MLGKKTGETAAVVFTRRLRRHRRSNKT